MTTRCARYAALALASGWFVIGAGTKAQQPMPTPATSQPGQLGLANSMYGSAPLNPYLNPYLMGMSPGNPDYLTYAFLANQRNGGIGSGVISGTRPAPGAAVGSPTPGQGSSAPNPAPSTASRYAPYTSRPAVEQNRMTFPMSTASVPGANTGGFFQRGPSTTAQGSGRYYSRMNPARNNGR